MDENYHKKDKNIENLLHGLITLNQMNFKII